MSNSAKVLKLWVPVMVWMGVIFFFSGIPDLKSGLKYDFFLRKVAHITEYFILTLLLYRAFKGTVDMSSFYMFIMPTVSAIFYAVSDEIHQYFVPGRTCTVRDILIDSIGVVGFLLYKNRRIYYNIKTNNQKRQIL